MICVDLISFHFRFLFFIALLVGGLRGTSMFSPSLLEYPALAKFAGRINLLLGSGSFTRKLILKANNFDFSVVKADIDERAIGDRALAADPSKLVLQLADAKADAIIAKISDNMDEYRRKNAILLTGDQVVVQRGRILEKPRDEEEARQFIKLYSNDQCSTVGSIALTHLASGLRVKEVDTSTIHFRGISEETIDALIEEGVCLQCAGGLMIEHDLLQPFITRIDGTTDSLMGLSCTVLISLLDQLESAGHL